MCVCVLYSKLKKKKKRTILNDSKSPLTFKSHLQSLRSFCNSAFSYELNLDS